MDMNKNYDYLHALLLIESRPLFLIIGENQQVKSHKILDDGEKIVFALYDAVKHKSYNQARKAKDCVIVSYSPNSQGNVECRKLDGSASVAATSGTFVLAAAYRLFKDSISI
jgi:hypothetical protein